jgi:hypothetical protein
MRYSAFVISWRRNGSTVGQCITRVCIYRSLKIHYDPIMREVLYKIIIGFSKLKKPVKLIKMCLNGT